MSGKKTVQKNAEKTLGKNTWDDDEKKYSRLFIEMMFINVLGVSQRSIDKFEADRQKCIGDQFKTKKLAFDIFVTDDFLDPMYGYNYQINPLYNALKNEIRKLNRHDGIVFDFKENTGQRSEEMNIEKQTKQNYRVFVQMMLLIILDAAQKLWVSFMHMQNGTKQFVNPLKDVALELFLWRFKKNDINDLSLRYENDSIYVALKEEIQKLNKKDGIVSEFLGIGFEGGSKKRKPSSSSSKKPKKRKPSSSSKKPKTRKHSSFSKKRSSTKLSSKK